MSVLLHVSLRKSAPEIGVKFSVFSLFSLAFFMKTLIKSMVYCQAVPLDDVVKILCQTFLPLFLTGESLALINAKEREIVCSA